MRRALARVEVVLDEQTQLKMLLDAVVVMTADLSLDGVLARIVATAARLTDAEYAALGVLTELEAGRRRNACRRSCTRDARRAGRRDRRPAARARSARADHRSAGAAALAATSPCTRRRTASHRTIRPCTRSSACRSASATGSSATSTSPRRPAAATSPSTDQDVVVALAAAAGVAIENARLSEEAARRERWLTATAEITALLAGSPGPGPKRCRRWLTEARAVAGADVSWIVAGPDAAAWCSGRFGRRRRP